MNCMNCASPRSFSDYSSVLASTVLCALVCWGENINASNTGRPKMRVIKAVFVAGLTLNTLKAVAQERRRTKLNSIFDKPFCSAPSIMR